MASPVTGAAPVWFAHASALHGGAGGRAEILYQLGYDQPQIKLPTDRVEAGTMHGGG